VSGLFVSLGRNPDLSWVEVDIKTNKKGYVLVDKNCQTSLKGIFACGDITARELKQIVTACSDGAIAASYIIKNR
jgi:thioredoxin reductase